MNDSQNSSAELAIVILNWNTPDLTIKCLDSILKRKWQTKFDVWVVDNASEDDSVTRIQKAYPQVNLIVNDRNAGYAAGNNLALRKAKAMYFLILNSDIEVKDNSIDSLMEVMKQSNFDIMSCQLFNKNGSFQHNAGDLPLGLPLLVWLGGLDDILPFRKILPSYHRQFRDYYQGTKQVGWVSGSVLMVKDEVLKKIGLLDEAIFMYGEDSEYCFRAKRAGFKVGWTDQATMVHVGGASHKEPQFRQWIGEFKGLVYFYQKYYGNLASIWVRLLIYFFTIVRIVAFNIIGRKEVAKTYVKVLRDF